MLKWLKEKGQWLLAILLAFLAGFIGAATRKPPRPIAREVDKELGRSEELARQTDELIKSEREKLAERKQRMQELQRKLHRMSYPGGGQRK